MPKQNYRNGGHSFYWLAVPGPDHDPRCFFAWRRRAESRSPEHDAMDRSVICTDPEQVGGRISDLTDQPPKARSTIWERLIYRDSRLEYLGVFRAQVSTKRPSRQPIARRVSTPGRSPLMVRMP